MQLELIYFVDMKLLLESFIEESSLVKKKLRRTAERLNTSEPMGFGLSDEIESRLLSSREEGPGTFHCQPARRSQFHTKWCDVGGNGSWMEYSE